MDRLFILADETKSGKLLICTKLNGQSIEWMENVVLYTACKKNRLPLSGLSMSIRLSAASHAQAYPLQSAIYAVNFIEA